MSLIRIRKRAITIETAFSEMDPTANRLSKDAGDAERSPVAGQSLAFQETSASAGVRGGGCSRSRTRLWAIIPC